MTNQPAASGSDDVEGLVARFPSLPSAHIRLLKSLRPKRWIKGTGFVHFSVVRDLILLEYVNTRMSRGEQLIRINDRGLCARATLSPSPSDDRGV